MTVRPWWRRRQIGAHTDLDRCDASPTAATSSRSTISTSPSALIRGAPHWKRRRNVAPSAAALLFGTGQGAMLETALPDRAPMPRWAPVSRPPTSRLSPRKLPGPFVLKANHRGYDVAASGCRIDGRGGCASSSAAQPLGSRTRAFGVSLGGGAVAFRPGAVYPVWKPSTRRICVEFIAPARSRSKLPSPPELAIRIGDRNSASSASRGLVVRLRHAPAPQRIGDAPAHSALDIDGARTSNSRQHLRARAGLCLGDPSSPTPWVVMVKRALGPGVRHAAGLTLPT